MTYIKQTHHAHEVPDNDIVQKKQSSLLETNAS